MEAMIVLFTLAQTFSDGDAMVLLVFAIPLLIIWLLMSWAKASDDAFFSKLSDEEED